MNPRRFTKTKTTRAKHAAVKPHPIIKSAAHLRRAAKVLATRDLKLAPCLAKPITFKLEADRSPYHTLFHAIVHQQLSPKAASTILGRVKALYPKSKIPGPAALLATAHEPLRGAGLSRNKITALKDLAAKTIDGTVPTSKKMHTLTDEEIVLRLTSIYGIGQWTVEMLLIFHLGRRDVFPIADYALRRSIAQVYGLKEIPTPKQIHHLGESWRPHRTAASLYLWNYIDPATWNP
jgi:3-methyladenine DNA glycosylase/8-oxoguanine DNA glycosylase